MLRVHATSQSDWTICFKNLDSSGRYLLARKICKPNYDTKVLASRMGVIMDLFLNSMIMWMVSCTCARALITLFSLQGKKKKPTFLNLKLSPFPRASSLRIMAIYNM